MRRRARDHTTPAFELICFNTQRHAHSTTDRVPITRYSRTKQFSTEKKQSIGKMSVTTSAIERNDSGDARTYNVTTFGIGPNKTNVPQTSPRKFKSWLTKTIPAVSEWKQYIGVLICGVTIWGTSWFLFKDVVLPGSFAFHMAGVAIAGYVCGHTIERYTTVNPVVGMTLTGALYRNFGPTSYLDDPIANIIDFHLRRIYPVIILTKGPLTWNWDYIKNNSIKVFSLATIPWIVECSSMVFFSHLLLDFPWYWGLHLGAILSSVSPAVVVPTVNALSARGLGTKRQIAQLVGNAGGLDTAFTEGTFGIINSAIFYPAMLPYRIIKAVLAIFVGIALGILWGILIDYIPDHSDAYAPTIRSLLILFGGLLISYGGAFLGWGGTSGVAIMVCAGTAATRWSRRGWAINNNPVAEVYKLLWRIFEPMLFTYSGYFLEISQVSGKEICLMLACIISALILRLVTAFLIGICNKMSIRESLFIAITWIPKAIVEAVLVRVAADSLWQDATSSDKQIASQHSNIIVIAILITSTLGSALTTSLGPVLLSQSKVTPEEFYRTQTLSPTASAYSVKEKSSSLEL
ncbi:sodium/hydrogen exchanger 9B2-like [Plodia interpunctella]|uniref:sodium/hydrogen exchanger 9B2-like n=1 Tax=Plodia interpunctella TaxID=58824 RepID=UPI0023685C70|nr:sodium/hydrogen exchanger 9B2-like [Plodia interpunctella]